MLNQRSFSQILNEIQGEKPNNLTDQDHTPSSITSGWESHLDPFGIAQILGENLITPRKMASLKKIYPTRSQPKIKVLRARHHLNEVQISALTVLMTYSPHIKDNFNLHELKSAYRLSVLKTHPDQGGNSETFQEVKKSYQILLALVKN